MKRKRALPQLPANRLPAPLSSRKVKDTRRWFEDNFPDELKDFQGRIIHIKNREDLRKHLISSSGKGGARVVDPNRAKHLNLIKPCIENPVEIYTRSRVFRYISPWKPEKGKRFVVVCKRDREGGLYLETAFNMEDGKVEKTRKGWKREYFRP